MKNSILKCLLASIAVAGLAMPARAADAFPTQPIRLLVGYAPGGSVDIVARSYARRLAELLGQSVVVDNRGGASGSVAAQAVAKAPPNGYTLYFVASPTVTITPALQKTPFDPIKDFQPIGLVATYTNVLLVNNESRYQSVADLVRQARANPGSVTYGSSGRGSSNHLSGELLAEKAHVKLTHVPYKGNAPALVDLMAGRISLLFDLNTTAINQVTGGKMRALAVTSAERNPMFPDVPTMMEAGFKDFEFSGWLGVLGPAGLPKSVADTLVDANRKILADPAFRKEMAASGYGIPQSTPEGLAARIESEGRMFVELAKRANLAQE